MTVTVENLAAVGNVVDDDYHHVTKRITPGAPLLLTDTYLKWYGLCREDQSISAAVDAEARAFVRDETAAGRLPISGDLGFVIHHLSGEYVHLLLVCTWRGNNEMWETAYYKDVREGGWTLPARTTGGPPGGHLRVGVGCGCPRTPGVDALSVLGPERGRQARIRRIPVLRHHLEGFGRRGRLDPVKFHAARPDCCMSWSSAVS